MATYKNTIKVPVNFGNPADILDATLTNIGTPTVYIPENSVGNPVTFTSVMLYVTYQDVSTATGATITEFRAAVQLNGASATTFTELDDLTNTGENIAGVIGPIDFTSHFSTNYGTVISKTCDVSVYFDVSTGTGLNTRGVYAWFEITYEYDDSALLRQQTISIPTESVAGALTTTANADYCTIPQIIGAGGLLENLNSVIIRHAWLEVKGNCNANNSATDINLTYAFNDGPGNSLPTRENALASDTFNTYLIDISALTLSTTNIFEIWSDVATRFHNVVVDINISFEYAVSGSTKCLCYIEAPIEFQSPINGTSANERHRFFRTFIIPEANPVLKYSGVTMYYNTAASATPQIRAGSQASFKNYAMVANLVCGAFAFSHLLDSRSTSGAALSSISRGSNDIVVDLYRSAGAMSNVSGRLIILYEADIPDGGIDLKTNTIYSLARQIDFAANADNAITDSVQIPQSNYWILAYGLVYDFYMATTSATLNSFCEVNSGEAAGDGWRDLYTDPYQADNELAYGRWYARARDEFKRHPTDPDTRRLDIEISRRFRTTSSTGFRYGYKHLVCFHSQAFTLSGNISGSDGGLINIKVFNSSNELMYETSRTGDGVYSVDVHDPVGEFYVVAQESTSKKGLSKSGSAATDFDINLGSGGGGSTLGHTSFGFYGYGANVSNLVDPET